MLTVVADYNDYFFKIEKKNINSACNDLISSQNIYRRLPFKIKSKLKIDTCPPSHLNLPVSLDHLSRLNAQIHEGITNSIEKM